MNRTDIVNEVKYSLSLLTQPQVVSVLFALALFIVLAGAFA